jgi:replication initiation and membrane attachment protein DnaB
MGMLDEWKRRNFQNKYYRHHRTGEEREDKDEAGQRRTRRTKNNVMTEDSGKWISEDASENCKSEKNRKCLSLVK